MPRNSTIQFRRGTADQWTDGNPVLASGEPGFEADTNLLKIGLGAQWDETRYLGATSLSTVVFNNTGSTIPKMSVVYITGGQGDKPTVALASASGEASSSKTYGITATDILDQDTGNVIINGALVNINTDQFIPNTNGTALWLSPTTAGGITTVKPYAPYHMVFVGTIVRSHAQQGIIEVKIQNGYELEELHNVATTGVSNGQFLQYNSVSGLWIPSSSGNFTSLSVNSTGVIVSNGGTSGYLSKFTNSNILGDSLIYDNGTNIGIGTTNPSYKLEVNGGFGAKTKSFKIDHPSKAGYSLEYGSLESPYHGVRLTGRGKLIKGVGTIQLPDYLKDLIHNDDTLNVQLTNFKHSKILYVSSIDLKKDRFVVKAHRAKTLGELEFFWTLTGTRKDVENLVVEKRN